jgi:toxin-antitoxin system PIN domain toxin
MRGLFDVNFLLAMLDERHLLHEAAHQWWGNNRQHGWATCPLTENGFVRIVTQPRYPNAISVGRAFNALETAFAHGNHEFWADDISLSDADRFNRKRILGPNQLTDIYLLGLAVHQTGRLVTFDRSISIATVRRANPEHLVLISQPPTRG